LNFRAIPLIPEGRNIILNNLGTRNAPTSCTISPSSPSCHLHALVYSPGTLGDHAPRGRRHACCPRGRRATGTAVPEYIVPYGLRKTRLVQGRQPRVVKPRRREDLVHARTCARDQIPGAAAHANVLIVMWRQLGVCARMLLRVPLIMSPGVAILAMGTAPSLQSIDVRQICHDYVPLVDHHAQREQSKKERFDSESHQRQQVRWMIDAAGSTMVFRMSNAVEEAID